jgi:hypothetical protein
MPGAPRAKLKKGGFTGAKGSQSASRLEPSEDQTRYLDWYQNSIIPRFRPTIAAWVRSFTPNLERMLRT